MMAGIRGQNTRPELLLRRGLHALGFRFRLHDRALPGRPDMVFPRYRAVLLAHGCFWHGHDCPLFRWPATRREFWQAKIEGNRARDAATLERLAGAGWRRGIVWECAIKGTGRLPQGEVVSRCAEWLKSEEGQLELRGGNDAV